MGGEFLPLHGTPAAAEIWHVLDTIQKMNHCVQMAASEPRSDDHLNNRNENFTSCPGKLLMRLSSVITLAI